MSNELADEAALAAAKDNEVPFNLDSLRKHLAEVAYARRLLPDDASTRQKLLEASVYDAAAKRMQREAEKLEELGINNKTLQQEQLQRWMFDWHKKMKKKLEVEIAALMQEEATNSASSVVLQFLCAITNNRCRAL